MHILAQHPRAAQLVLLALLLVVYAEPLLAATPMTPVTTNPWETAVNNLQAAFTGTIARGLSLVAIVLGGLMFAFGEGGSKKAIAGIIFGVGMAMGAANFLTWLQ